MKDVAGFEGFYAVTEDGRVWSYPRQQGFFFRKGRWLKGQKRSFGYIYFQFKGNGKIIWRSGHRLVASAFIANPDNLPCVGHRDNNPANNIKTNLEWITHKENSEYMVACHRSSRGISHHNAKLNPEKVIKIRQMYVTGRSSLKGLAMEFGVSKRTILFVVQKKHWSWVK